MEIKCTYASNSKNRLPIQSGDECPFMLRPRHLRSPCTFAGTDFALRLRLWTFCTFIRAAAAFRLMTATESRLRLRGNQLRVERELENEQRDAAPGVRGLWVTKWPSTSSATRNARPRDRGSTTCWQKRQKPFITIRKEKLQVELLICVSHSQFLLLSLKWAS